MNIINFSGWLFLIFHVGIPLFWDPKGFLSADIEMDVHVLRFIQTFQIMDIMLILIGKSKGSILGAFFQIVGRMVVAWGFAEPTSNNLRFATVAIIWALADCNRYLYYLFKNHPLTAALRYNSFIVLYPIGVFGEMLLINDYLQRHIELTENCVYLVRAIQASIVVGLLFLYTYMLKMRAKYYKKVGGFVNSFLAKPAGENSSEKKSLNKLKEEQKDD